eukprot:gnl/TRDRNA2_/TRDRNA2_173854_c1_seq2.p1 gnl/TRDRNA2_/TRDRNA2_173854_c1~~gnl/TRDRNA2_/TRDRNA2_173854_c1_seq2.p1  ORF type:complete len:1202 (-),score=227.02 gnl/TRDRNA2_/TRDRNA2_173854_c1_seq2:146-3628(-)
MGAAEGQQYKTLLSGELARVIRDCARPDAAWRQVAREHSGKESAEEVQRDIAVRARTSAARATEIRTYDEEEAIITDKAVGDSGPQAPPQAPHEMYAKKKRPPYVLVIPSYGRPERLQTNTLAFLRRQRIAQEQIEVWLAPGTAPGQTITEEERYQKALKKSWPRIRLRVGVKGIMEQRWHIGKQYAEGTHVVSIDDDVPEVFFKVHAGTGQETLRPLPAGGLEALVHHAHDTMIQEKAYIWGLNPSANPMNMVVNSISRKNGMVNGFLYGYRNRHDESLKSIYASPCEDVERSCRVFDHDGVVLRYLMYAARTVFKAADGINLLYNNAEERKAAEEQAIEDIAVEFPRLLSVRTGAERRKTLAAMNFRFRPIGQGPLHPDVKYKQGTTAEASNATLPEDPAKREVHLRTAQEEKAVLGRCIALQDRLARGVTPAPEAAVPLPSTAASSTGQASEEATASSANTAPDVLDFFVGLATQGEKSLSTLGLTAVAAEPGVFRPLRSSSSSEALPQVPGAPAASPGERLLWPYESGSSAGAAVDDDILGMLDFDQDDEYFAEASADADPSPDAAAVAPTTGAAGAGLGRSWGGLGAVLGGLGAVFRGAGAKRQEPASVAVDSAQKADLAQAAPPETPPELKRTAGAVSQQAETPLELLSTALAPMRAPPQLAVPKPSAVFAPAPVARAPKEIDEDGQWCWKFSGFHRPELNTTFFPDSKNKVRDKRTFWDESRSFFAYWQDQRGRWAIAQRWDGTTRSDQLKRVKQGEEIGWAYQHDEHTWMEYWQDGWIPNRNGFQRHPYRTDVVQGSGGQLRTFAPAESSHLSARSEYATAAASESHAAVSDMHPGSSHRASGIDSGTSSMMSLQRQRSPPKLHLSWMSQSVHAEPKVPQPKPADAIRSSALSAWSPPASSVLIPPSTSSTNMPPAPPPADPQQTRQLAEDPRVEGTMPKSAPPRTNSSSAWPSLKPPERQLSPPRRTLHPETVRSTGERGLHPSRDAPQAGATIPRLQEAPHMIPLPPPTPPPRSGKLIPRSRDVHEKGEDRLRETSASGDSSHEIGDERGVAGWDTANQRSSNGHSGPLSRDASDGRCQPGVGGEGDLKSDEGHRELFRQKLREARLAARKDAQAGEGRWGGQSRSRSRSGMREPRNASNNEGRPRRSPL